MSIGLFFVVVHLTFVAVLDAEKLRKKAREFVNLSESSYRKESSIGKASVKRPWSDESGTHVADLILSSFTFL